VAPCRLDNLGNHHVDLRTSDAGGKDISINAVAVYSFGAQVVAAGISRRFFLAAAESFSCLVNVTLVCAQ